MSKKKKTDKPVTDKKTDKPEKKRRGKKGILGNIISIFLAVCALLGIVAACANYVCYRTLLKRVNEYDPIVNEEAVIPEKDKNGEWTFTTDRDLKILDLSDLHIGSGWLSTRQDRCAINAVAAMITAEKPDLVILSGDLSYPMPVQTGTVNNAYSTKIIIALLERLGVSWAPILGNHDSEIYSIYDRAYVSSLYAGKNLKHCLYQEGHYSDVDGYGNYVIHVRNSSNLLVEELIMMDSGAYKSNDPFGIRWKYDNIHENQIQWYKNRIDFARSCNPDVKSLVFIHIPLTEMRDAVNEYTENGNKDTDNVQRLSGVIGTGRKMVYCGVGDDDFFETIQEEGNTQAVFFAHDHRNNIALKYIGVDLVYNMSVDYIAIPGIEEMKEQRGCSVITVNITDGSYSRELKNYYENYYESALYHNDVAA